jgi:hypothetical protein
VLVHHVVPQSIPLKSVTEPTAAAVESPDMLMLAADTGSQTVQPPAKKARITASQSAIMQASQSAIMQAGGVSNSGTGEIKLQPWTASLGARGFVLGADKQALVTKGSKTPGKAGKIWARK